MYGLIISQPIAIFSFLGRIVSHPSVTHYTMYVHKLCMLNCMR